MSFNFDFKIPNLPDFSKIDLTGLPSNLNLGTLGTSGASIMDSPPQQIDASVEAALSRLIIEYLGGENPYRADYDIDGDGKLSLRDAMHQQQIEQGIREPITPAVDPVTAPANTTTANKITRLITHPRAIKTSAATINPIGS